VKEAPASMLIAMGTAAFFCIFLGVYPKFLYSILPYPVDFVPYTASHVLTQMQLLMFSALAFTMLLLSGIYPAEIRAINIDADLFYRKGGRLFYSAMDKGLNGLNALADRIFVGGIVASVVRFSQNGPVRLALIFLVPFWKATGLDAAEQKLEKDRFLKAYGTGALSLGLFGLALAFYLLLLFF